MVKKVILIVLGLFALLGGLLFAGIGAAALALGGRSGTVQSGYHHIDTSTSAFVTDPASIRDNTNLQVRTGTTTTLRIATRNTPQNLFVGVGPSDQVTAYLNGTSYEEITNIDFSPFKMTTNQVLGTAEPAAPGDQSFWVASAVGSHPSLNFNLSSGSYRVVVMNADGSPGVVTDVRVGIKVPALFGVGLGSAIGGTLVALLGLGLLIWGIAAKRKPAVAAGYGPVAPYPGSSYPAATPYGTGGPYAGGGPVAGTGAGGVAGAQPPVGGPYPAAGSYPTGGSSAWPPDRSAGVTPSSGAPDGPPSAGSTPPEPSWPGGSTWGGSSPSSDEPPPADGYTPTTPSSHPGAYPPAGTPYRPPSHTASDPTAEPPPTPPATNSSDDDPESGGWRPR